MRRGVAGWEAWWLGAVFLGLSVTTVAFAGQEFRKPPVAEISGEALAIMLRVVPHLPDPVLHSIEDYVVEVSEIERVFGEELEAFEPGYRVWFYDRHRCASSDLRAQCGDQCTLEQLRAQCPDVLTFGQSPRVPELWFMVSPDLEQVRGPIYVR